MSDEELVIVPIPPLVTMLLNRERAKGSPLTEAEVLEIRDGAICMTMRASAARKLAEERGFDDIDPENVWEEWQAIREELGE